MGQIKFKKSILLIGILIASNSALAKLECEKSAKALVNKLLRITKKNQQHEFLTMVVSNVSHKLGCGMTAIVINAELSEFFYKHVNKHGTPPLHNSLCKYYLNSLNEKQDRMEAKFYCRGELEKYSGTRMSIKKSNCGWKIANYSYNYPRSKVIEKIEKRNGFKIIYQTGDSHSPDSDFRNTNRIDMTTD